MAERKTDRRDERKIDTIIMGSGIAGLYYAYKMRNCNFVILEKSDYIGGRLKTSTFHKHPIVCGAGVGRWNKDVLLKDLLKQLNIPVKKSKSIKYYLPDDHKQAKFINDIIVAVKKYHKMHPQYIGSFREVVTKLFSKDTLQKFVRINGYGDFVNEDFRETILHYGLEDNRDINIFSVSWGELVKKLVAAIGQSNIKLNYCVQKITANSVGEYTIYTNKQIFHNVKNVIIATDITAIYKFFPNNVLYKFVCGQSFSRIYAQVDISSRKIMQELIKGYTIVEGPLQKIIPIDPNAGIYMIAYNDNKNADATKSITRKKLEVLVEFALGGQKIKIVDFKVFYWKVGTHYFKPYSWRATEWPKYLRKMQNPAKNIKIIGEAFSLNQGWVEGALESVQAILLNRNTVLKY